MSKLRSTKGFTLIELMIVIAMIAIIASVAIPNIIEARIAALGAKKGPLMQAIIQAGNLQGAAKFKNVMNSFYSKIARDEFEKLPVDQRLQIIDKNLSDLEDLKTELQTSQRIKTDDGSIEYKISTAGVATIGALGVAMSGVSIGFGYSSMKELLALSKKLEAGAVIIPVSAGVGVGVLLSYAGIRAFTQQLQGYVEVTESERNDMLKSIDRIIERLVEMRKTTI